MRHRFPVKHRTREEIQRLIDLGIRLRGDDFKKTATYRSFQIKLEWWEEKK